MTSPQTNRWRFRYMSIRSKLLIIMLMSVLLMGSVALCGFQLVVSSYNEMIYSQTASALNAIADKVGARLDTLMEISLYIAVNREFQSALETMNQKTSTTADNVARSSMTSLLYSTYHSDLISISVLPYAGNPVVVGEMSSQESDAVLERIAEQAAAAKGAPVWLSTGRADASVICAREIRNVTRPFLEPMGLLLLRVKLDKIVRESSENILSGAYDTAISQNSELLYPYVQNGEDVLNDSILEGGGYYAIAQKNGETRFVTRSDIKAFRLNWSLTLGVPYDDIFRSLIIANAAFIFGLAGAAVLALLLSQRMQVGINRNVQLLTNKMNRVRLGDLTPYPDPAPPSGDELGLLSEHFDKMTADFKQVLDDNYVKELLLTQTQLKALVQQINPHFLFNSLDSINWFARRESWKDVSTIAQALGSLLRSTISEDEDLIPLRLELAILNSYLRIQRIRFSDRLQVQVQTDEAAMDVLLPKMSIQPLVENAIVHALEENVGDCHICVRVAMEEQMVRVEVVNDGSEIDVDILHKLRNKSIEPKGHGIGLINIESRLHLLFGPEYSLELRNSEDGVHISFRIPARKGEDKEC